MEVEGLELQQRSFARVHKFSKRVFLRKTGSYVSLTLLAIVMVIPFIWTLSTSFKGPNEAVYSFPPQFIPQNFTLDNYVTVWQTLPIPLYLWNSIILSFFGVILPLFFSSLAAFPLARMQFKGKQIVFLTIMATMMIPGEVTMIPVYLILNKLGLLGTFAGVILPGAVTAFGIFLMRQAFIGIPREVEESAVIDGANVWQIWWKVMLPMVKPMLATLGILSFIAAWNNFLWPLLVLDDPNMFPLTLGLYKLQGTFVTNTRHVATGAVIALVPILILFVTLQRYFIQGAYSSAVKG